VVGPVSVLTREVEQRDITGADVWGPDWEAPPSTSTAIPAVYGAVRLIGDEWAQAPITVTEPRNGELEMVDLPLILEDPDPYLSEFEWRFALVAALKLRGNAYGLVDDGRRFCRWLPNEWVTVDESNRMKPVYRVNGRPMDLVKQGGNLVHIREFTQPGSVVGLSPIEHFAATFETSALARQYGRRWFKGSSMPPAILSAKTPRMDPALLVEARDDFVKAAKSGLPVALPGEWDYTKITVTPEEAQFLLTIQATANEVAVIFGVPPEKVGGRAGSSRSYSNVEMDQELFEIETLGGVSGRVASGLKPILRPRQRITFDLTVLKQPGALERARIDTEELRNGTTFLEEARRAKGKKPPTAKQIADWQQWYSTTKSAAESLATSIAIAQKEG